jgi:hypothetical protein
MHCYGFLIPLLLVGYGTFAANMNCILSGATPLLTPKKYV